VIQQAMPHNFSPMIHALQSVALCVAVSVAVPSEVIEQAMPDIFSPIIVSSSVPVSFSSGKVYFDTVVHSNCRNVNSNIRHYCNCELARHAVLQQRVHWNVRKCVHMRARARANEKGMRARARVGERERERESK